MIKPKHLIIIIPSFLIIGCQQAYYQNKPITIISESCSQYISTCYSVVEIKSSKQKMQIPSNEITFKSQLQLKF